MKQSIYTALLGGLAGGILFSSIWNMVSPDTIIIGVSEFVESIELCEEHGGPIIYRLEGGTEISPWEANLITVTCEDEVKFTYNPNK